MINTVINIKDKIKIIMGLNKYSTPRNQGDSNHALFGVDFACFFPSYFEDIFTEQF